MRLETLVVVALSTMAAAYAFAPLTPQKYPFLARRSAHRRSHDCVSLSALIYGWDGEYEDDATTTSTDKVDVFYKACEPEGIAVAESISYNKDKTGHLARLAVAFSPPERALKLKDIENVEVVCVSATHIDIEAIICEDGGCVSLAVPVSFPSDCGTEQWLEGCVLRNLDELDVEAESLIQRMEQDIDSDDLDELCLLNTKIEYPSWWVPPECDAGLVSECYSLKNILNQEEFQDDVKALAQQRLNTLKDGDGYEVNRAKVADVGPAGLCLKVQAAFQYEEPKPIHVLDVMVPFGGDPMENSESLRAAVLGVVATS